MVASVLIDGGLSYMLYKGLNALFNQKHDDKAEKLSAGYDNALGDMEARNLPLSRDTRPGNTLSR